MFQELNAYSLTVVSLQRYKIHLAPDTKLRTKNYYCLLFYE